MYNLLAEESNPMDYLNELEKWQAVSHAALAQRKPETLFAPAFVEIYQRSHQHVWERMVRLHGTIRTLEELNEFPFDHLYAPNDMEFWRLVVRNFVDSAVLILHGLVNDTGEDVLSLRSFKNAVVRADWLEGRMRDALIDTLAERKFDNAIEAIAGRVDRLRDHIAHSFIDKMTGFRQPTENVPFGDLKRLFDAAHRLFGALSFGSAYVTLAGDLVPSTIGGKPRQTCLGSVPRRRRVTAAPAVRIAGATGTSRF